MLLAFKVGAYIPRLIHPCLNSLSMLEIVFPIALILCSVLVCVYTFAISFVESPFSFEDVFISMLESSLSVGFIVLPETFGN